MDGEALRDVRSLEVVKATSWTYSAKNGVADVANVGKGGSEYKTAVDDDGKPARRGTQWTAFAHIITSFGGAGLLSLAWGLSQTGWVFGPLILILLSLTTLYSSILLSDCYRYPDTITGTRNYSLSHCVKKILGERQAGICAFIQYASLYGGLIAYTIVGSSGMAWIARSVCYRIHRNDAHCSPQSGIPARYMIVFGVLQIILSRFRDLQRIRWLSMVSTTVSFGFSLILLTVSAFRAFENGHSHGTAFGIPIGTHSMGQVSGFQKFINVSLAIANMSSSFLVAYVVIEIQDTLKSSPPENKTMRKAISMGLLYITMFYISLSGIGYAAYGNNTPGNLLLSLQAYHNIFWLIDIANLFVTIQMMGSYQVCAQTIYGYIENKFAKYFASQRSKYEGKSTRVGCSCSLYRIMWRSFFVILTTILTMLIPFFNSILGFLGASTYWPLTIYFPVFMHMKKHKVQPWSTKWICLHIFVLAFFLIAWCGIVGSIHELLRALKKHQAFVF